MPAYTQYTRAEIRTMLTQKVESVPFWVAAEANDAINEALLVWNSLTGQWKAVQTITTTKNNWDYALSTSLVFGTSVLYEGIPLTPSSKLDMDAGRPRWQSQTTADGGTVPTTPQVWFPLSIDLIAIWPADAIGGHTLTVSGISQTPTMDDDADYIEIGAEQLNSILSYALHTLAFKEGGDRFTATLPLFQSFLAGAAEENKQLMGSDFFRQFIGTDIARQERPPAAPNTDYEGLKL